MMQVNQTLADTNLETDVRVRVVCATLPLDHGAPPSLTSIEVKCSKTTDDASSWGRLETAVVAK